MKNLQTTTLLLVLLTTLLVYFSSCEDDSLFQGETVDLSFSVDTLRFDTVFTEVGTITRFFKIYNNEEEAVIIDNITLGPDNLFFRMNVDGNAGATIEDTRIEAQDSIYVFIEATIDPDNPRSVSPFIIEQLVNVEVKASNYDVLLEAYGQNANYIPNRFADSQINGLPCNGGSAIWNDPKPYVIYGVLGIDNCRLQIAAGTKIYVHGGVAISEDIGVYNDGIIVVTQSGTIDIQGTAAEPVLIRSDRLEEGFQETPGQWAGILLQPGSRNNRLTHTIIQHSIVGLSVDSTASAVLDACEFSFTSGNGLSASHATVTATNCLYYQNGSNGISIGFGGDYTFNHCTVANYDNQGSALNANNIKCTDPLCQEEILSFPLDMTFNNCIFVGNDEDEISILDGFRGNEPSFFQMDFNNAIVIVDELLDDPQFSNFLNDCNDCFRVTRSDTLFVDLRENDFHLDSLSLPIDKGLSLPNVPQDIEDNLREIGAVDIGCYEYLK